MKITRRPRPRTLVIAAVLAAVTTAGVVGRAASAERHSIKGDTLKVTNRVFPHLYTDLARYALM